MDTTGTATGRESATREVAARMAAAAAAWLNALDPAQRAAATGDAPSADAGSDAERRRWFYTPTDHGGLPLGAQRPHQQQLAHRLVAAGLSDAGICFIRHADDSFMQCTRSIWGTMERTRSRRHSKTVSGTR